MTTNSEAAKHHLNRLSTYSIGDLQIFVVLATRGSFSSTARAMGVTTSSISKRIAALESRIGLRLIQRTTREISLTQEGYVVLEHAQSILRELTQLDESVSSSKDEPQGLIRVNATFRFGREYIAPAIVRTKQQYPKLSVELLLSDRPLDLIREGIDLSIQFGSPPASRLVARKLLSNKRYLCAAPDYLAKRGTPKTLADLRSHNCIVLKQNQAVFDTWTLSRGGQQVSVKVSGDLSSNDGEVALLWVLNGMGIMLRSEWDIARLVQQEKLRIVLPQYFEKDADIYAVYHQNRALSLKTRVFIEQLKHHIGQLASELTLPL